MFQLLLHMIYTDYIKIFRSRKQEGRGEGRRMKSHKWSAEKKGAGNGREGWKVEGGGEWQKLADL